MNVLTIDEFRRSYSAELDGLPERAVGEALRFLVTEENLIPRRKAGEIASLARRFAAYSTAATSVEDEPDKDEIDWILDPEAVLSADRVADSAEPEVREARESTFGSADPPFETWGDAVKWIESTAARPARQQDQSRLLEATRSTLSPLKEAAEEEHLRLTAGLSTVLVSYVRPSEATVIHAAVRYGYWPLADAIRDLAGKTGFVPALVTLWVLTGLRPLRPRATYRITHRFPGAASVEVAIHSPAVTREEVYELVKEARELFEPIRRKKPTARDKEFIDIVRATPGRVPDGDGAVAFWTRVLAECRIRSDQPNYAGSGWRGPYNRWNRLVERGVVTEEGGKNAP